MLVCVCVGLSYPKCLMMMMRMMMMMMMMMMMTAYGRRVTVRFRVVCPHP